MFHPDSSTLSCSCEDAFVRQVYTLLSPGLRLMKFSSQKAGVTIWPSASLSAIQINMNRMAFFRRNQIFCQCVHCKISHPAKQQQKMPVLGCSDIIQA